MATTIEHDEATIMIDEINPGVCHIRVEMKNPETFSPLTQITTRYPINLIKAILKNKGPAWLCDEIARDEDPTIVEQDLLASLFSYVPRSELNGKRLLDFGCGSGSSTMILARALPDCHIIGAELNEQLLEVARLRAAHYNVQNLTLLHSPIPDQLPEEIEEVDFVVLSAVYEHLLPLERPSLLGQMWQHLATNGVLFINQTPDRRFPIETHTTGLPLINFLPNRIAHLLACKLSKRGLRDDTWMTLLRKGIRGATPTDLLRDLRSSPSQPILLKPKADGISRQSDIWYISARKRISERYSGLRRKAVLALMTGIVWSGVPIAPYISLAIRKGGLTTG